MDPRPAPGTRLMFEWRKWDGSPHWVQDSVYLGSDEWGEWFGQQVGWRSARPGAEFVCREPNVTLVPATGDWAFTHNADPHPVAVYIDLGWDVRWHDDGVPRGIDMDLDVVRRTDDRGTWIDDRDEWDEHRVRYGYPAEIVTHLEATALDLERRVRAREAPFSDDVTGPWLARLAAMATPEDPSTPRA